ncbi:hypothetical protein HYT54_02045 [Candidatus Woesearchaeota archaeon]|nr:hypothetical protein [Candidatus Woesearchaeota archaeon]
MNKVLFWPVIAALSLIFIAGVAYAAPSYSLPSELNFGDANRNQTVSRTFTVTNNGDVALTNILMSSNVGAQYNVTFDQPGPITLNPAASQNIQATIRVPAFASSGANITIGNIQLASDQLNSSFPMKVTVKGGIIINELRMNVDYSPSYAFRKSGDRKDTVSGISNGARLDLDVEPDSNVTFEINAENLFQNDEDNNEMRDVQATIVIEDINDGEDIEVETNTVDLGLTDNQWLTAKAHIPKRVEQKTYTVQIVVEGDGRDGSSHNVDWEIQMPVTKETHDIRFDYVNIGKNPVQCGESVNLNAALYNAGRNGESDLKLEIVNPDLGLNYVKSAIFLDIEKFEEESSLQETIPVNVGKGVKPGVYPIKANLYWQNTVLFDERTISLEVLPCGGQQPAIELPAAPVEEEKPAEKQEEKDNVPVVAAPGGNSQETVAGEKAAENDEEPIAVSKESSFRNSPLYMPLIIGANLIVLVGILGVVVYFARKK